MIAAEALAGVLAVRTARAAILGREAFERGAMRVSAHDPFLMPLLRGFAVGQGANVILDAWLHAWDAANLAAPVPEFPEWVGHGAGVCLCHGF